MIVNLHQINNNAHQFDEDNVHRQLGVEHQRVWIAVLQQSFKDLMITTVARTGDRSLAREQAHRWFADAGEDFCTVCEFAGVDPDRLHNLYMSGDLVETLKQMHTHGTNHRIK